MSGIKSVYLAHNFGARIWLREVVSKLKEHGINCTSRWIFDDSHVEKGSGEANAMADCQDVDIAEAVVLFVDQFGEKTGKGKWFEFGYAVAHTIPVFIVGADRGCVFSNLPESWGVYKHSDFDSCLQALKEYQDERVF